MSCRRVSGVFRRHWCFQILELRRGFLTRMGLMLDFLFRGVLLWWRRIIILHCSWRLVLICNLRTLMMKWRLNQSCLLWGWLRIHYFLMRRTSSWDSWGRLTLMRVFTSSFWGRNHLLLLKPLSEDINLRIFFVELRLDYVRDVNIRRNFSVE